MPVSKKTSLSPDRSTSIDVPAIASRFHLTPESKGGTTQYRGKNFLDPQGSQSHQFILFENGNAFDHKLKAKYSLVEVAIAAGLTGPPDASSQYMTLKAGINTEKRKVKFDWRSGFDTYPYKDANGELLFEVVRQGHGETKVVSQRRPNPDPAARSAKPWLFSLGDVPRVLYCLQEVMAARVVLICEGEKAVEYVRGVLAEANLLGEFAATTNPHGAGKWKDDFSPALIGKVVYVFPDNDDKGEAHAPMVAASVAPHAKAVYIVDLPDMGEKWGVDDWLLKGRAIGELLEICEATPVWTPLADAAPVVSDKDFALDEIGNGQRFASEHRDDLRYCSVRDQWQIYSRGRWEPDNHGAAEARAKITARNALKEAFSAKEEERRAKLIKHAAVLAKRATRSTMINDAASEDGMMVTLGDFDTNPNLFNCANGTLNLSTGEFRPHDARDLLTLQSPVSYDPNAKSGLWLDCMERWIPDTATRNYVQDTVGATLSGVAVDEFFNFLHGEGGNGKSRFLGAIETLMGSYGHKTQAETLMAARDARKSESPSPAILALRGARLVTSHEIDEKHQVSAALLKDLTGRDAITARGLYEKRATTFNPQFTLWLVGNSLPRITDTSPGMWRRVRLIEFGQPIAEKERDPQLAAKLEADLAGIFNWALEGLRRVQRYGLIVPDAVNVATALYRAEQDPLGGFLSDCCEMGPKLKAPASVIWKAWENWCDDNGEQNRSAKWLANHLRSRKCEPFRSGGINMWSGISLIESLAGYPTQAAQPAQKEGSVLVVLDVMDVPPKSAMGKKTERVGKGKHADSEPY